jgi:hypothetical protein
MNQLHWAEELCLLFAADVNCANTPSMSPPNVVIVEPLATTPG